MGKDVKRLLISFTYHWSSYHGATGHPFVLSDMACQLAPYRHSHLCSKVLDILAQSVIMDLRNEKTNKNNESVDS